MADRFIADDAADGGPSVGRRVRRVDAEDKVTGAAAYVDDLRAAGMLHAAVVLPRVAHARLLALDASGALAVPGVAAVVTAEDIPGANQVGVIDADQPLLVKDTIRYTGDAVALVVADSPEAAREGAAAVALSCEELPAVFDAEEAMARGAPRVHDGGNVFLQYRVRKGNAERGFAGADVVVERTFRTFHQEHSYLETMGAIAVPDGRAAMTVYGSMQCPFYVQKAVATALGLPLAAVRVVQTVTGGGFGGKEDSPSEICACAAVAAWKVGRPVKLVYSREEDFYRSSKRHPMTVTFRLGATRDGAFTAARIRIVADAGAYSTLTPVVLFRSAAHATGPYEIPNVETDAYGVYTNGQTTGAFRGFGQPQTIFANESVVDEVAAALGMDPIEIRLLNGLDVGRRTATNQLLTESVGLRDTLRRARDVSGWDAKRAAGAVGTEGGRVRRGIGVASIYYGVSLGAKGLALDGSGALVNVYRDGSVRVAVGGTEMGQGLLTVLSQIAADALGIAVSSVRVDLADTSAVPDSGPSVASRTTLMTGNAVLDAVAKIRAAMGAAAAEILGVPSSAVAFAGGRVAGGDRSIAFGELADACWAKNVATAASGWYAAPVSTFDENGQGDAYAVYSYATHVAEVEVDTETGAVRLVRMTAAHDVGKVLNPTTLEGQVEGGVLQAAGMALFERMRTDRGRIVTPDFSTYIIPTAADAPEIASAFVEHPYSRGPFGAKGIGETPAMPGAAAIANAVANAVGIRFSELPITAELVTRALTERKNG
ncbi:MAG: xanthine dehydrogenase family protein [Candidatus Eisenbacteria bacterium]|nr:xanthine dehydrogenase family protein [Candidatus Eisenbacteria bacterium]